MIKLKSLPSGALPYDNIEAAKRMMVKLFNANPFLPFFPNIQKSENILHRTISNFPQIIQEENKLIIESINSFEHFETEKINNAYKKPTEENLEQYGFESIFMERFLQITEKEKPNHVIVNFIGPFSLSCMLKNEEQIHVLNEKLYRKYIIQILSLKSIWFIKKIKKISPKTIPIIILEEPKLYKFGMINKENENISKELVIDTFSRIIKKIHDEKALVCIQSFKKCDWQIPIDAGADIISFDAYNNPFNLNIIRDKINNFLHNGGLINWAIVPVMSENIVKNISTENLSDRLINTMQGLIDAGVSKKRLFKQSSISAQGDISEMPLIFAEKALIIESKLGTKMFT